MKVIDTIKNELTDYLSKTVESSEGVFYSEYRLKRRIGLFESQTYPTGKLDAQKKYKYWFDIITPRRDSEVKNIDFDTKDVRAHSDQDGFEVCDLIVNIVMPRWMKDTGRAAEINAAVEEFSGWGNVLFERTKDGYERCDLRNVYIINQTAKTVDETPVIKRALMTQSELRLKEGVWKNVAEVVDKCQSKTFAATLSSSPDITTSPYYEIFERNGEVSVAALKEAQGDGPAEGDEDKFVLARIIVAGIDAQDTAEAGYVLFAEAYPKSRKLSDYFVEGHRGPYKGRWFREGMYELLFECQTRANEIGNQLARGLEYASKKFFSTPDKIAIQNVLTGLKNGDVLRGTFQNLDTRMDGFDQLLADWNRNLQLADAIANSREVVQGESLPSGTPFRLGGLLNINANKLFDLLREKLAIPLNIIYERWLIPQLVSELKAEDYAKLTGRSEYYDRLLDLLANAWYLDNLIVFGPHDERFAQLVKDRQKEALQKRPELLAKMTKDLWDGYKPTAIVDITGEATTLDADLQSAAAFIPLMADPVRRDALILLMMKKRLRWIDVDALPKSTAPVAPLSAPANITNQVTPPANVQA